MVETIHDHGLVKANKQHQCSFCRLPINKGDHYEKKTLKFDGDIYTWKNHTHCHQLSVACGMYDHCDEGVTDEDFRETIICEYKIITGEGDLYIRNTCINMGYLMHFVMMKHNILKGEDNYV